MRCLIGFTFDEIDLCELTAQVATGNQRSIGLLERLGFTHTTALPASILQYRRTSTVVVPDGSQCPASSVF